MFINVYHNFSDFKRNDTPSSVLHSIIGTGFHILKQTQVHTHTHNTIASFPFCPRILETQPQCLQLLEPSASHEMSWNHIHKQSWGTKPEPPFMLSTQTNAIKDFKCISIYARADKFSRWCRVTDIISLLKCVELSSTNTLGRLEETQEQLTVSRTGLLCTCVRRLPSAQMYSLTVTQEGSKHTDSQQTKTRSWLDVTVPLNHWPKHGALQEQERKETFSMCAGGACLLLFHPSSIHFLT